MTVCGHIDIKAPSACAHLTAKMQLSNRSCSRSNQTGQDKENGSAEGFVTAAETGLLNRVGMVVHCRPLALG